MAQKGTENSKDISWKNKQLKSYFKFKFKNVYLTSVIEICIFANVLLIPSVIFSVNFRLCCLLALSFEEGQIAEAD